MKAETAVRSTLPAAVTVAIVATALLPLSPAHAAVDAWSSPIAISAAGQTGSFGQVVTDGVTDTALWLRSDGAQLRVQSASAPAGTQAYGAPATLSTGGGDIFDPHIAAGGSMVAAVWIRSELGSSFVESAVSTNSGLSWGPATAVSLPSNALGSPQVAIVGSTVHVIWRDVDDADDFRIIASSSTDAGANWAAQVAISAAGESANDQRLTSDGSSAAAVWLRRTDGTDDRVEFAAWTLADGWSAPQTLSAAGQDATQPVVAMHDGTIAAAWSRTDGSHYRTQVGMSPDAGLSWNDPITLSAAGEGAFDATVKIDAATVAVAWRRYDGSHERVQVSSSANSGVTWRSPTTLSAAGNDASEPALTVTGTRVIVAWSRNDGETTRPQSAGSENAGLTWGAPVTANVTLADKPSIVTTGRDTTMIVGAIGPDDVGFQLRIQALTFTSGFEVTRTAGADRYSTAVQIAQAFDPGVPVVYIATGTNYPDALSAASAAAYGEGPLLLTARTSLPSVVATELQRLDPEAVVIVGGTGAVSAAVESRIATLLPGVPRTRYSGADRYETSRLIADGAFSSGATTVYVATGRNFPDALSASAAAGADQSPVVLVDGRASAIGQATRDLFAELGVENVVIAGGTGVVSAAIEAELQSLYSPSGVTRLAGSDRYATSVAINAGSFTQSRTVYLATGLDFPDALAGAAVAGGSGSALFVVRPTCVPANVLTQLYALDTRKVVLLGGTGVLSSRVANLRTC